MAAFYDVCYFSSHHLFRAKVRRHGGYAATAAAVGENLQRGHQLLPLCAAYALADPLSAYYFYDSHNINVLAAVFSTVALILVTAACWHFRKEKPYCFIGWLWFLGTLAPVIGIVQVGEQAMAERYTYVPFVGLFIAVVWLIGDAVVNSSKIRVATLLLAAAVIAACAVKTDTQVKVWGNSVTLFSHVLDVDPRGELPNLSLGIAYMNHGRLADAQEYYDRALNYKPSSALALSYSAFCVMLPCEPQEQRNLPLAEQRLDQALRLAPDSPDALTNMALWSSLMGRPKDMEMYSRKAIAANPDFIAARLSLGDALLAQNELDEAAQEYRQALAVDPNNYDAHDNLGIIFDRQGLPQEAIKEFRLSLAIKPDQAVAHSQIGRILVEMHRLPEAVEEFTQSLRIDPANANTHNNLGVVLFQMRDYEKAVEQFSDAVQTDPANADAKRNLDGAQALMKNVKVGSGRK